MTFEEAVVQTLEEEGPLSYDTDDGLPTKWGIRAKYYPEVLNEHFNRDKAIAIYRRDYWMKVSCDKFPPYMRFMLFECAVNQGQVTAIKLLQQALRIKQDGWVGPVTIQAAINAGIGGLDELLTRRLCRYAVTDGFVANGLGWVRRAVRCHRKCLEAIRVPIR